MKRRDAVQIALGVALAALSGEVSVRLLTPILVRPLSWYAMEAQVKADELVAHAGDIGWADIVFVGNSLTRDALDPGELMGSLPCDVTAYNAALSGFFPRNVEHWVVNWVLPTLRPSMVILGVTSGDLLDGSAFHQHYFSAAATRQGLHAEAARWLERYSSLLRYRAVLRDPVYLKPTVARLLPGMEPNEPWENRFTRGYVSPRGSPSSTPESRPLPGADIDSDELDALERTLRVLHERSVRTWIIEMPVQPEYIRRHPGGEDGYRRMLLPVRQLAREHGARYLDLSRLLPRPEDFQDLRHVRSSGARQVSARLVQELSRLCDVLERQRQAPTQDR